MGLRLIRSREGRRSSIGHLASFLLGLGFRDYRVNRFIISIDLNILADIRFVAR